MYRAACRPPAPEIGCKPFPITSSPTNVITPELNLLWRLYSCFPSISFLSSFPLEGKRKRSETSRTIPGKHLGVNQTSWQSKPRCITLHSTLLMESDLPSMHTLGAWKVAVWSCDIWLWCFSFSPSELVLYDLGRSLPASCHWRVKPFQVISQNRNS